MCGFPHWKLEASSFQTSPPWSSYDSGAPFVRIKYLRDVVQLEGGEWGGSVQGTPILGPALCVTKQISPKTKKSLLQQMSPSAAAADTEASSFVLVSEGLF